MVHHDWGLPVAIDLFAAGMGAAAFMVAVMADLAGSKKFTSIRLTGAIIAPWPAILGVLLLVVDLGQPLRFWEMILKRGEGLSIIPPFIMFNHGSAMSWGTWILTLFVIISLIYLVVSIIAIPFSWGEIATKAVGIIGLPFALLVTTYTGVLISATSNELWSNYLLPLVFVSSAVVTGIASIICILAILKMLKLTEEDFIPGLEKLNGTMIIVLLISLVLFIALGIMKPQMLILLASVKLGILFWLFTIILGIIIPLIFSLKKEGNPAGTSFIISLLILLGGFFLRYIILMAGQIA
jgi:polysulfide reductase chain C